MITWPGHRRTRLLITAAAVAVSLVAAGSWAVEAGALPAEPQPLTSTQSAELTDRIITLASTLQTQFLVTTPGSDPAGPTSDPTSAPAAAADALATRIDLSREAVHDVAAYATRTQQIRASMAQRGTLVESTSVVIDSISATRRLGGPLRVCARVHSTYRFNSDIPGADVIPWVLTLDSTTQKITEVQVQDWDDGGYDC